MRALSVKFTDQATFRLSRVLAAMRWGSIRRAVAAHAFVVSLAAFAIAYSVAIALFVGSAAQRVQGVQTDVGQRESAFALLGQAHRLDRSLRLLRAHAIVRHRIAIPDRTEVERALLHLEEAAAGAVQSGRFTAHVRAVGAAWARVTDRRSALHDVDATLAANGALETAVAEVSALSSDADDRVTSATSIYVDELPTIDDRMDQERNLIAGMLAAHRQPRATLARDIFEHQWRHAYDAAVITAERTDDGDRSIGMLAAVRRLGFAGAQLDAAVNYAARGRRQQDAAVNRIERRAENATRQADAVASVAIGVLRRAYDARLAAEDDSFGRTRNVAVLVWALGLGLAIVTALGIRIRDRRAGERLYGGVLRELDLSHAHLEALFAGSSLGIAVLDRDRRVLRRNAALEQLLGRGETVAGADDPRFDALVAGDEASYIVETVRERNGASRWFETAFSAIRPTAGPIGLVLSIVRDVTSAREAETRLRYETLHDPVTRLPNRQGFIERLEAVLAQRAGAPAVALIDLRSDASPATLGGSGDDLTTALAARLASSVEPQDFVARFDGSTFAVMLQPRSDRERVEIAIGMLIKRLGDAVTLDDRDVAVSARAGVTIANRPFLEASEFINEAELAMYDARSRGRRLALYSPEMRDRVTRKTTVVMLLRRAIERDQLHLAYQPIVSAYDGEIRAFEALLRWEHPELGNIAPDEFIPLAEETGVIESIGRWVLDRACAQLGEWRACGHGETSSHGIAVNVAVRELLADDYPAFVTRTLSRYGIPARDLTLEITESAALVGDDTAAETLGRLRAAGVGLAIDDFGTGYSSLRYLHDFAFDQLKIDGSFVRGDGTVDGLANPAIVTMLAALGKSLRVEVVAEGVETKRQAEELMALGVDCLQGYHLGRPANAVICQALLRDRARHFPPPILGLREHTG